MSRSIQPSDCEYIGQDSRTRMTAVGLYAPCSVMIVPQP